MGRGKLATQVAQVSMKFLLENNEAERGDQVVVKLTPAEASWLSSSIAPTVVGVDSEDKLRDLIFRAELFNIDVYPIVDTDGAELDGALTCAAFGPCDADELDRITGNLKLM